jgi:hypothetical protein
MRVPRRGPWLAAMPGDRKSHAVLPGLHTIPGFLEKDDPPVQGTSEGENAARGSPAAVRGHPGRGEPATPSIRYRATAAGCAAASHYAETEASLAVFSTVAFPHIIDIEWTNVYIPALDWPSPAGVETTEWMIDVRRSHRPSFSLAGR